MRALIAGLAVLLLVPAAASAKGTWGKQSDFSHVHVDWQSDDGKAYTFVRLFFPQPVDMASTNNGEPCTPQADPKELHCPASPGGRGPGVASGGIDVVTTAAVACKDDFV